MELQKTVLNQYLRLSGKPTLKQISKDTGIQLTRVFRLFNGSTMKLSEYQVFDQRIKEKLGTTRSLEAMAIECSLILSQEAVGELEIFLRRRIDLWKLTQISKNSRSKILTA